MKRLFNALLDLKGYIYSKCIASDNIKPKARGLERDINGYI